MRRPPTPKGNRVRLRLEIEAGGSTAAPTVVEVDTAAGCVVQISGPIYPADLETVSQFVQILRDKKTRYQPNYGVVGAAGVADDAADDAE